MLLCILLLLATLAGCGGGTSREELRENRANTEETRPETGETTRDEERMDVRDAVGQMFVVGMGGTEPDYYIEKMIRERNIGGVLLFGNNMQSEEQTKALTSALQELSMQTEPAIPLFVAVDHEGGEVQHAPWVPAQPSAAEVGDRGDSEEARRIAVQIGRELRRGGVNTNFAPVVDTGSGAAIGSRSYGEDPALVASMGVAAINGFQEAGIVSSAKHFPNHGPATEDSHVGRPIVDHDMRTILREDLAPFRAAVEAGAPMVMAGHLVYPAIDPERPASISLAALELLRGELGFEGVVVTDDLVMEGARRGGTTADAALQAIKAGADLLIVSGPPEEQAAAYDAVVAAVESGKISRERIDASVERIENIKSYYSRYSED
ncbi:MAG: beta-N-acetylhexosaminidase [Rubrobacteraceae bacterium]